MALPDKHQLKFNIHKDAKSLMDAIEKRILEKSAIRVETHTLIWRNKADLEKQSLDDLFNNLKIYKAEVKGSSPSSQNTQNISFVSSNNTDSLNESVTAAPSIFAASSKATVSTLPNVDSLSDVVIYSFFASQSNSPQLDNEDLKQINPDDLEEMDLKWQMAMLTMRAKRFLKRTRINLGANGTDTGGFDMYEVKCYNCHRRGHFSREYRSPRDNRNKDTPRRTVPLEVSTLNALVDNALTELRKKFKKAKQERNDLKLTLDKFQTLSKNLSKLLKSQVNDKTNLGFDSQVFNSQVFDCEEFHSHESDNTVPKNLENDRPVPTAVPQSTMKSPRPVKLVVNKAHSPIRRPINHKPAPKNSNFNKKVTTVKVNKVNDVQGTKGNAEKATANWGNPQQALNYKGVIDSGCSRHMTRNISFLSDFKEIDGGYVAFGGNPKGVSQMCDKKSRVLFTDIECVVFSSDYKMTDENHVLLRVPRENNMYNVNLKNIVPSGDMTCLFAKATLDESNLSHRRLEHINFKTMNKLVKGNLVRGLPSKIFKSNHTCVACRKGKQHKAFCNGYHQRDKIQAKSGKTENETESVEKSKVNQSQPKSTQSKSTSKTEP
nr:ribonuclease H-like domain-containing protein [Tanacetum cinerariifolium]